MRQLILHVARDCFMYAFLADGLRSEYFVRHMGGDDARQAVQARGVALLPPTLQARLHARGRRGREAHGRLGVPVGGLLLRAPLEQVSAVRLELIERDRISACLRGIRQHSRPESDKSARTEATLNTLRAMTAREPACLVPSGRRALYSGVPNSYMEPERNSSGISVWREWMALERPTFAVEPANSGRPLERVEEDGHATVLPDVRDCFNAWGGGQWWITRRRKDMIYQCQKGLRTTPRANL